MSDRIGVMRAGKLVQVGSPQEIYSAPQTRFVSEFIGDVNVIAVDGKWRRKRAHMPRNSPSTLKVPSRACRSFTAGHLVVRPEFLRFIGKSRRCGQSVSKAASTTNMCSVLASSTRCGSAITYSSSRNCASRPSAAADDKVPIGWDAEDSILVTD